MQIKNNLYYAWMEFSPKRIPTEEKSGQLRRYGGEVTLSTHAWQILNTHFLKPKSTSPRILRAIAYGYTRQTTITTRQTTDEALGSTWKSRVGRVRKDKKIVGLCMQIQNLRDAITSAELAENRNEVDIAQLRSERKALQQKVHLLMKA